MANEVHIAREVPGPASAPSGEGSSPQFGLTAALALIGGGIAIALFSYFGAECAAAPSHQPAGARAALP